MATAKKSAAKKSTEKNGTTKKGKVRKDDQLPPIIIKGGTPITIEYEHDKFPQVGSSKDHTRPSGKPDSADIFEIVVEVPTGKEVGRFDVTKGKCKVTFRLEPEK